MKYSTSKRLLNADDVLVGIEVTKFDGGIESDKFIVPVIDVRNGEKSRIKIDKILKNINQSRYSKPSFSVIGKSYQVSHKKDTELV